MKKITSIAVLFVLCALAVTAGGSGETEGTQITSAPTGNLTQPGTFPIAKQKITVSITVPAPAEPTDYSTNYFTSLYEEKSNIHIEWQPTAGDFKEKVNLMFASGDLTDMIVTGAGTVCRINKTEEAQFGEQGLIIPLEGIIESQSVWLKKVFEEQPGLEKYITTPDGHIFALPNIDDGYHVVYPQKMWINTTWLRNLGLSMPKTTEEFYRVLKAFKEKDPNGNGKADEIPFSSVKAGSNVELDGFLMNPFSYSPGGDRLWVKDGKVVLASVQPGYKEGLKYLNRLYREGLIYKESFTQDKNNQVNLNESGDVPVIGAFPALRVGYGTNLSASTRWHQYNSVPPLTGPSGQRLAAFHPYTTRYTTGFISITSACKTPEAAFRLADWMYSEEGTIAAMVGREGKEWAKAASGELGMDGRPAKYKYINVNTNDPEYQNITWGQLFANYRPKDYQFSWVFPQDPYDPEVSPFVGRMRVFYLATTEHEKVAQKPENTLPALYYSAGAVGELSLLKTTIDDYVLESVVRFITGDLDIDKDWDGYLAQFKQLGLDRYLQIIQESYSAQYGK